MDARSELLTNHHGRSTHHKEEVCQIVSNVTGVHPEYPWKFDRRPPADRNRLPCAAELNPEFRDSERRRSPGSFYNHVVGESQWGSRCARRWKEGTGGMRNRSQRTHLSQDEHGLGSCLQDSRDGPTFRSRLPRTATNEPSPRDTPIPAREPRGLGQNRANEPRLGSPICRTNPETSPGIVPNLPDSGSGQINTSPTFTWGGLGGLRCDRRRNLGALSRKVSRRPMGFGDDPLPGREFLTNEANLRCRIRVKSSKRSHNWADRVNCLGNSGRRGFDGPGRLALGREEGLVERRVRSQD
jgi:hypothetical protein